MYYLADRLQSDLIKQLLYKLNKSLKDTPPESQTKVLQSPDRVIRIISVLDHLLPFVLMYVTNNEIILSRIEKEMTIELSKFKDYSNCCLFIIIIIIIDPGLLKLCSSVTNPNVFSAGENVGLIFYEFDKYIAENVKETWCALDWLLDNV